MPSEGVRDVRPESGFTLVELVVILVIVGILAVVVIPRFTGTTAFDARGFHDRFTTDLRYARTVAVASQCPVTVTLSTGSPGSYAATIPSGVNCGGGATALLGADGTPLTAASAGGVSLAGNASMQFNGNGTATAANFTVSGAGFSGSITVIPMTGYVQSSP